MDGRKKVRNILTLEMNGRDVSVKKGRDALREELKVIVRSESVEAAGEEMEHLVAATKDRQQHVVVDVLGVVDVLCARAVGFLASEAGNGGREDEDVTRLGLAENRLGFLGVEALAGEVAEHRREPHNGFG